MPSCPHFHILPRSINDRGGHATFAAGQEARYHPQSNILLSCLGTSEDPPLLHHRIPVLKQGDVLMACSDGIWHYFAPEELSSITRLLSPREASQFLIERAGMRATGTGDNMSLAIVKIEPIPTDKPEKAGASKRRKGPLFLAFYTH